MLPPNHALTIIGYTCLVVAAIHGAVAVIAVAAWRCQHPPPHSQATPPVTLLKPLCGAEPGLYENLRSFCEQDYPKFQIVFGLHDPMDPALMVAQQLAAEFPRLLIDIVVDPRLHGSNCKVSNLINMLTRARFDVLVMADSDARVSPEYLRAVTAPLSDPGVGLVTCIYSGTPTPPLCSRIGAMFINEWFMPSVLLAWLFGHQAYVSGQTLAIRAGTLQAIGGLRAIASHLADDNRLGELVRGSGLRIVLSHFAPTAEHHEPTLRSLTDHEVRWMRTLRALRPASFSFLFLTFTLPIAALGMVFAAASGLISKAAWLLFGIALLSRVTLHIVQGGRRGKSPLADFWLLPARDLLICWIWLRSSLTSRITWRDNAFSVSNDGLMQRLP